ncbi:MULTISPECIES: voltage-gated potassium channel protein [unclassified Serratia (in: enterobacteria)]|uniref:voltage-gated potassium channel protein n=1 Tax=unclassified Serratia (in: enterobacteria) TaxID=2647522 RepID=UPI000500FA9E|nr:MULTISPECIES: voltage-gated potassium channel protein [unclassified Serratia (in: enterobacteria)]KFK96234.1 voltage-gated potassium channel TrkA [Serratia sp. Ag2]KFL00651.1 voltage-gated potassium channel TrkA [Serratia sp. Ag1]
MRILNKIERFIPVTFIVALMVAHNGYLILSPILWQLLQHSHDFLNSANSWHEAMGFLDTMDIPRLMIGVVLIFMAIILLFRARLAWFFALMLLGCIVIVDIFIFKQVTTLVWYSLLTIAGLAIFWRRFDHHSLGSTSFFAIASMASLIVYSMLGTLYIGEQFTPKITDLPTAFYFAIVCMSTVGFGDIIPHTTSARMFTLTVIIFGITVFAASIASVAGTLISQNLQHIMKGRFTHMIRRNHYIIIGTSSLAQNVYQGLIKSGGNVTLVCEPGNKALFPEHADVVEGDPSSVTTLTLAGAAKAKYIVALTESDAVNAFIILAAKEAGGLETKTIALVNESQNMSKIKRVKPDAVLSLQLLGSELLVRSLNGETINNDLNLDTFFSNAPEDPKGK